MIKNVVKNYFCLRKKNQVAFWLKHGIRCFIWMSQLVVCFSLSLFLSRSATIIPLMENWISKNSKIDTDSIACLDTQDRLKSSSSSEVITIVNSQQVIVSCLVHYSSVDDTISTCPLKSKYCHHYTAVNRKQKNWNESFRTKSNCVTETNYRHHYDWDLCM